MHPKVHFHHFFFIYKVGVWNNNLGEEKDRKIERLTKKPEVLDEREKIYCQKYQYFK